MKPIMREDEGAIAMVAVVLFSFVMLFFAAIVVDAGVLYVTRAQLQAAADAGALEGCRVLSVTSDPAQAETEARAAAAENAVGPGAALRVASVAIDMSDYSVQVVVEADANMYFSRASAGGSAGGPPTRPVRAAARAQRQALSGARYLVPWGLPIIENVDRVEAVVGGISYILSRTGSSRYEGDVVVPAGGGDVAVHVYNTYGVDEVLTNSPSMQPAPAARVSEMASGYPFSEVSLSDDYLPSNAPVWPTLTVRTAKVETSVRARIAGQAVSMTNVSGGTLWACTIPAQTVTNDLINVYPIDVYVGGGPDRNVDTYLHVRRSTHPILDVSAIPAAAPAGSTSHVVVDLSQFTPSGAVAGQTYTLRVGSGSSMAGNFAELSYAQSSLQHQSTCPPDTTGVQTGNRYAEWVIGGYPGAVHLGDIIGTSPGGSGSVTERALDDRMRDEQGRLIVEVPIVEKYQEKSGGVYDVIVVNFASFEITSYDRSGNVEGKFIQYITTPSTFGGSGGTGAVYAPRLVNPVH